MARKKIVVAGATGALGSKIVKALLEQGADVTAMVRVASNRTTLEKMGVKNFVVADLMNKSSLQEALSPKHNFDAIVASAAGYTRHSKGDTPKTDTIGYRNLIDATKESGIPRFALLSILECDKAVDVPHFYNKYRAEKYLKEKQQSFIAVRSGAFLDQTPDFIRSKINKGVLPVFFQNVDYGIMYTPDLARYLAIAATSIPDSALNTTVDVGWSTAVNSNSLAATFEKILKQPIMPKPIISQFIVKFFGPLIGIFSGFTKDMFKMIKWVEAGAFVSKSTQKQVELFGDLPSIEEGVRRYCKDKGLIS